MISPRIREAIESADPADRWMHGFTNSGHPPCCAVALKNIEILEREGLLENSARMGALLDKLLHEAFDDHPYAGDIRGGKGLIAAVEFVEDRGEKRNFAAERKIGARLQAEMRKRGLITRQRPVVGDHPASGDEVLFAPPLVINESEVQRMVSIARDAADAVFAG
jgi:L-2,4-diaminobutyrate transaminase